MDKIFSQFGIQPILLLAQIVNFLVLLFILNKLLYKPLLKVLSQRKQKIEESLKNAEEIALRLQKTEEESQKKLEKAASEAQKIIDETKKSAQDIIAEARLKAQSDVGEMIKKGQESINTERDRMHQEIKDSVAQLVGMSLTKVIEDSLSMKDQKEMLKNASKRIKI